MWIPQRRPIAIGHLHLWRDDQKWVRCERDQSQREWACALCTGVYLSVFYGGICGAVRIARLQFYLQPENGVSQIQWTGPLR